MQNLWRSPVHGQFSYHSVAELIARIPSKLSHKVELAVSIVANAILAMSQYQMAFWQLSSNIMQRWQINSTETHLPISETPKSKHSRLHLVCQERLHWNFRITNNCCCYLRANREEILAMSTLQKVIFSGEKNTMKSPDSKKDGDSTCILLYAHEILQLKSKNNNTQIEFHRSTKAINCHGSGLMSIAQWVNNHISHKGCQDH